MDERKLDSAAPPRSHQFVEPATQDSKFLTVGHAEIRIDGPHPTASARPADVVSSSTASPASPLSPPAFRATPGVRSTSTVSTSTVLAEAGLLLQQMLTQQTELSEREATLEQRLLEFEDEQQRALSLRMHHSAELEQSRQRIASAEAGLSEQILATETLQRQVEADQLAYERERVDLECRRAAVREDVLVELRLERQTLDAERLELSIAHERVRSLTESLEEQLLAATAQAEQLIQSERERLWQTLIAEWEERRSQFQLEYDQWHATSQAEKLEIEREKAFYEAAVRETESNFAATRDAQAAELQAARERHLSLIESERQEQTESLAADRRLHLETLSHEQHEWQQRRTVFEAEMLAVREREQSALTAERNEWTVTYTAQRNELQSERAVLESRIRFQQEHLEKLREDLERAQNEHRHRRQVECQHLEDSAQIQWRRMRQIDLYRASIEEREKSLDRERDVLSKSRRALSSTTDLDRIGLHAEREAWDSERQIQLAELRRQQELMTSLSENLESRRIRLDRLRAELEDTHRTTLEMRLAVEETWVDLTQSIGQEESRQRVEQVRNALVGYYRQLHEGLVEQRREHLEAQTKFERLRTEFLDERQKLMDWIAARDSELQVAEERLKIASSDSSTRDAAWQAARDRWLMEKAEAEQVIRKLLGELGDKHRDAPLDTLSWTTDAMMIARGDAAR